MKLPSIPQYFLNTARGIVQAQQNYEKRREWISDNE